MCILAWFRSGLHHKLTLNPSVYAHGNCNIHGIFIFETQKAFDYHAPTCIHAGSCAWSDWCNQRGRITRMWGIRVRATQSSRASLEQFDHCKCRVVCIQLIFFSLYVFQSFLSMACHGNASLQVCTTASACTAVSWTLREAMPLLHTVLYFACISVYICKRIYALSMHVSTKSLTISVTSFSTCTCLL